MPRFGIIWRFDCECLNLVWSTENEVGRYLLKVVRVAHVFIKFTGIEVKKILDAHNTIKISIALFSGVVAFHALILLQIVPYGITWGGRLNSIQEMYVFESLSIVLNLFLIFILLLKAKQSKMKFINRVLWLFFALFSLNTIGNLFAETVTEKLFSIVTFVFAILLLKILIMKEL